MNFLQVIIDFFESVFNRNSPEVQKKIKLKKLELELRSYIPAIFKNGKILPNFAEAVRLLYINTVPVGELLAFTISSSDAQRAKRFESQLVLTGYTIDNQQIIDKLSYEERKKELLSSNLTTSQVFDLQQKQLTKILNELHKESFRKINKEIINLYYISDFCKYNFTSLINSFDPDFIPSDPNYVPSYREVSGEKIMGMLEDLYFVLKNVSITASSINIISALSRLTDNSDSPRFNIEIITANLKKAAYIMKNIITPEKLKMIICYAKADSNYTPHAGKINVNAVNYFAEMLHTKFKTDEQRIKAELKDEKIVTKLSALFEKIPLLSLKGYNDEINKKLQQDTQASFLWVMPMRILKTFVNVYLSEGIRALLNDIVIEGFFNNSAYKTNFSNDIYAILETAGNIQHFEEEFEGQGAFSQTLIESYICDGLKTPDFLRKLEHLIASINVEAGKLVAFELNNLNKAYKHIAGILQDSKKPSNEIISNLKVLMFSSRNKDNAELLESQYAKWEIFFEIMKNYAIITAK